VEETARPVYPFSAIIGQEEMKFAALMNIIDPNIGGIMVMGDRGTGKSTTITNIIASYLFKQKKVLFIAEKKTALDVVYKKLKDKDLDKFVFRLSSTAEKKTSIIDEIKDRLTIKAPKNIPDSYTDQKEYNEQINKIRSYGKILDTEYFAIKKQYIQPRRQGDIEATFYFCRLPNSQNKATRHDTHL
jgi:predicted ATP-dependent serine protease